MKKYIIRTVLAFMLLLPTIGLLGQGTPPPPPPGHGGDDDFPTPTGQGLAVLAILGIAYGCKKLYDARKSFPSAKHN